MTGTARTLAVRGKATAVRAWAAVVTALIMVTGCLPDTGGPAATAPFADFAKVPPPDNILFLRSQRDNLRVPPLLVQACKGPDPKDFGEDYLEPILAEVTLLRMRETEPGRKAISAAVSGPNKVAYPPDLQTCLLGKLSWTLVVDQISKIPELTGTPGTAEVPTCRSKGDWDVTMALLIRIWLLARDHYNDRARVTLDAKVARQAWLEGKPSPRDASICPPLAIPETENHQLLIETTRYLHNEWLPMISDPNHIGKLFDAYVRDHDPDNARNGLRELLRSRLASWRQNDFLEYNSRPYTRFQMIGLLNLYDLARDDTLRGEVRAVLDLLAAKAATEAMGELRSPPFRRRAEFAGDPLFNSDVLSTMMQVWVGDLSPISRPKPNYTQEMTLAASSTYRPPDVLADLMLNPRHRSYLQGFNGRNQWELAYGTPEFVISGGGLPTGCPYPVTGIKRLFASRCKGSGNDPGTSQPVVLIPRRLRDQIDAAAPPAPQDLPGIQQAAVYSDGGGANTCIGRDIACAAHLHEGRTDVKPVPECRRDGTDPATGDTVHAWQMSKNCVTSATWPTDSCLYVSIRSVKTIGAVSPLDYLLTRPCAGGRFSDFADYVTTGGGRPLDRPPAGQATCVHGAKGGSRPCDKGWSTRIQPPRRTGQVSAGDDIVTLHVGAGGSLSYLTPDGPHAGAASGDIANTTERSLHLADPAAGEALYDYDTGVLKAGDGQRDFAVSAGVDDRTSGNVHVAIGPLKYPDLVHDVTVTMIDQTQLGIDCTITLPGGGKGCADPRLCEIRGCPNVTQPTNLLNYTYYYRGTPFESGAPVSWTLTRPGIRIGHDYAIRACVTWWRFLSSADYRTDPYGVREPTDHQTCTTQVVLAHRYLPRLRLPPGVTPPPLPR